MEFIEGILPKNYSHLGFGLIFGFWILAVCVHEFSHALVAFIGGDDSAKGYLTFNPLKYIDPGMSIALPLAFLLISGFALPGGAVRLRHDAIRNKYWLSAMSLAGPGSNLLLVTAMMLPVWKGWVVVDPKDTFWIAYMTVAFLQLCSIALCLVLIPPMDGFRAVMPFTFGLFEKIEQKFGNWLFMIFLLVLMTSRPVQKVFWGFVMDVSSFYGIDTGMVWKGIDMVRFNIVG